MLFLMHFTFTGGSGKPWHGSRFWICILPPFGKEMESVQARNTRALWRINCLHRIACVLEAWGGVRFDVLFGVLRKKFLRTRAVASV